MRTKLWNALLAVAAAATILSCGEGPFGPRNLPGPVTPRFTSTAASLPDVRFSEIHYDNSRTDANEWIEVSGPAGTDLTGWQIVRSRRTRSA